MLLRLIIFKNVWRGHQQRRSLITALYLAGNEAKDHFAVLTPYMTIDETLKNRQKLEANIKRRRLDLNLEDFYQKYDKYVSTRETLLVLERKRDELFKEISNQSDESEKNALKERGRQVRVDLKNRKLDLDNDGFVKSFLELPNEIDSQVPENEKKILFMTALMEKRSENHLEIDKGDCIELLDNSSFFLKGNAARFDYQFPALCSRFFRKQNFVQFSNPDFVRTVLVEGAGSCVKETINLVSQDGDEERINLLHLCGGGSMLSFLGFVTKLQIFGNVLPLRFISTGKQYNRIRSDSGMKHDLFNVSQGTVVQLFSVAKSDEDAQRIVEDILADVLNIYKKIPQIEFRAVLDTADNLKSHESLKISIQMYCNSNGQFVEIANVIKYQDYISKRLLFTYKEEKLSKFPHLISSTVADIPKIIACWTENNGKSFSYFPALTPNIESV